MSFRITTNMMMKSYRYNLTNTTNALADARDKVLTQRNFNSYAENPADATLAFRLRRSHWQTSTHLNNSEDVAQKFNSAWTAVGTVVDDLSDSTARASAILGITGTAGESRTALGQVLRETAESVIQTFNSQYGDQFIFAGNDGLNVPFSWSESGDLLYRGINVNAGSVAMPEGTAPDWGPLDENGIPADLPDSSEGLTASEQDWYAYYQDQSDVAKLKAMSEEELNIDLGMGMKEDKSGQLIDGSAFDMSLPGIRLLGYGVDKDGEPQNLALMMKELGEVFSRCNNDSGAYASEEDEAKASRLLDKLKAGQEALTEEYVELDSKSTFLNTNISRLTEQQAGLNEQILNLEQVDLATAITEFSWQQYCYNAALKIGNQLLSQSLIDYMN